MSRTAGLNKAGREGANNRRLEPCGWHRAYTTRCRAVQINAVGTGGIKRVETDGWLIGLVGSYVQVAGRRG